MVKKKLVIRKLELGGDFYSWDKSILIHFRALGLEEHVVSNTEITVVEGAEETVAMKSARCMSDLLSAISQDLQQIVIGEATPNDLYLKLKKLFLGTSRAEIRSIKTKLERLTIDGNDYFSFMQNYNMLVRRLSDLDNDNISYIDLSASFLNKFGTRFPSITHPLKVALDQANAQNAINTWTIAHDRILEYLMDAQLYSVHTPRRKKALALMAEEPKEEEPKSGKNKKNFKCHYCKKKGHFKRDCRKKQADDKRRAAQKGKDTPEVSEDKNDTEEQSSKRKMFSSRKLFCQRSHKRLTYFILDSGASYHSCSDLSIIKEIYDIVPEPIETANGILMLRQMCTVEVTLDNGLEVEITNCAYYPGAPSLISVLQLLKNGISTYFNPKTMAGHIRDHSGEIYRAVHEALDDTCRVYYDQPKSKMMQLTRQQWHERLNHAPEKVLKKTLGRGYPSEIVDNFNIAECEGCLKGKMKRSNIRAQRKVRKDYAPLEILHADVMGPYPQSINRKRGILTIADASTNYVWAKPIYSRAEVPQLLLSIMRRLERQFPGNIKCLHTDNAAEFLSSPILSYLYENGIQDRNSSEYVHEENAHIEAVNGVILDGIRSSLYSAGLSIGYWSYAAETVAHQHNCIASLTRGHSPWELLYGSTPDLTKLRTFGSYGFRHIPKEKRKKLDPTGTEARFLGYCEGKVGYLVQDFKTRKIGYARDFKELRLQPEVERDQIHFNVLDIVPESFGYEPRASAIVDTIPYSQEFVVLDANTNSGGEGNEIDLTENVLFADIDSEDDDEETNEAPTANTWTDTHAEIDQDNIIQEGRRTQRQNLLLFYRIRRLMLHKKRYRKTRKGYTSYKEALAIDPKWEAAYFAELKKLEQRGDLKIVEYEDWMSPMPFREVLTKKKDNISGDMVYKVRLAARGDLQKDKSSKNYSPTIINDEIRTFFAMMKLKRCYVSQGDCPGAYLNGRLGDVTSTQFVYLWLPLGHPMRKKNTKNLVYKCPASLYGLAVSGKVWYVTFCKIVKEFGFVPYVRCPCLFKTTRDSNEIYLQLFVDDFIYGSTSAKLMDECSAFLEEKLNVKVTGDLKKFVGLEINLQKDFVAFNQTEMIMKLAEKYEISRSWSTPMTENFKWNNSKRLEDIRPLQSLIGELNFIVGMSRPDGAFALNKIARMTHKGTLETYRCAKRVLAYLVTTAEQSMIYRRVIDPKLELWTDSSYADVSEDRFKSTGGYLVYYGKNIIHWRSKKLRWVANSSTEAEYLAAYYGIRDAIKIGHLLEDFFDEKEVFPFVVYCDNQSVMQVVEKNSSASDLTKSMKTKYFKLLQWYEEEYFIFKYVKSADNLADIMTKPLGRVKFCQHRRKMLEEWGCAKDRSHNRVRQKEAGEEAGLSG